VGGLLAQEQQEGGLAEALDASSTRWASPMGVPSAMGSHVPRIYM
jgi:hypothetical protein